MPQHDQNTTDQSSNNSTASPIKIGVLGGNGRVGALIITELQNGNFNGQAHLAGCTIRNDTPHPPNYPVYDRAEPLFELADIVIDFTHPAAIEQHTKLAATYKKPLVIGTTGLTPAQEQAIHDAAQNTAIVYAANMSVGVNILTALVTQAAKTLGLDYDIEISETHHKHKIDSPSGTALALAHAAKNGREISGFDDSHYVTERSGARQKGDIGFAVQRGGDVTGEHMVTFYGEGERLELGHKATNRSLFAKGAIRAAIWAHQKPAGLYTMQDVLGLNA